MKLKNMKFVALVAVGGLLALSPALLAQDSTNAPAGTPPAGAQRGGRGPNIDRLAQALNLTDDQKAKVQPILEDQMKQMRDLRQDTSMSMEDKRAKMKDIRTATMAKMKDILTPDQFTQYQQMTQRRGPRPGGPPADNGTNAPTTPPATPPQQ